MIDNNPQTRARIENAFKGVSDELIKNAQVIDAARTLSSAAEEYMISVQFLTAALIWRREDAECLDERNRDVTDHMNTLRNAIFEFRKRL